MNYPGFGIRVAAVFSPLEWAVIELSRSDTMASLSHPSLFGRVVVALFRVEVRRPLASVRLEALRRVAVRAWHTLVRDDDLVEFERAGYTLAQAQLLIDAIGARRREGSIFS